jgi:hypothetical protein
LDDLEYARHAFEQALKLNEMVKSTDPVILMLNYAISLFNHKQYEEAHEKLLFVHDMIESIPKGAVDPEVKAFSFSLNLPQKWPFLRQLKTHISGEVSIQ